MSKNVTITDIAKEVGISVTTISFVLNGEEKGISEKTKEKVLKVAQALGYKKRFVSTNQKQIKLLFLTDKIENFNFHTSFFSNVYSYIQSKSDDNNINLSLYEFDITKGVKYRNSKLQHFINDQIDVFITTDYGTATFLKENGMKVILAQSGAKDDILSIYCDDFHAGELVANCAIKNGHKNAGIIFPASQIPEDRFSGFFSRYKELDGVVKKEHQCIIPPNITLERCAEYIYEFYLNKIMPTFLYCYADNIMFPTIKAFVKMGLRIPDDISIMGTDNLYWGAMNTPPFSTIDLCEESFAEHLINAITHIYKNSGIYQLSVPVKLIERGTVKKL